MQYVLEASTTNGGTRGRTVKFTPERMAQIKNLVERGQTRDEIADIIGCTVGSLQVTCSRAGISLRRPRPEGAMLLPRKANGGSDGHTRGIPPMPQPAQERPSVEPGQVKASLVVRMEASGKTRETAVPLPLDIIGELAIMADLNGLRLGDLLATTLADFIRKLEGPGENK